MTKFQIGDHVVLNKTNSKAHRQHANEIGRVTEIIPSSILPIEVSWPGRLRGMYTEVQLDPAPNRPKTFTVGSMVRLNALGQHELRDCRDTPHNDTGRIYKLFTDDPTKVGVDWTTSGWMTVIRTKYLLIN